MPIKPYEFTKSADIIAQSQEQIQQMRMSNDPNIQKMAHNQQFLDAIFKLPEIRKAQKLEGVMSAAAELGKEQGESETDYQIRQQEYIRRAAAELDPKVSLQANDELIRLQAQKMELDSLRMRRDKDQQDLATAQQLAVDEKTPTIFQYDLKTGQKRGVRKLRPDMPIEEVNAILADIQATDPASTYTVGNASELYQVEDFEDGSVSRGLNRSAIFKGQEKLRATAELKFKTNQFLKKMIEAPLALLPSAKVEAGAGSLLTSLRKIAGDFIQTDSDANEDLKVAQRWLGDESGFASRVEAMGIEAGIARGIVLDMAYSLAKSKDSGRLSDQDVNMAIKMLTGEGNPNEILGLLRLQMEAAAFSARNYKEGVYNGTYGEDAVGLYERFEEQDRLVQDNLNRFEEILKAGGLIKYHQSAFGESSLYKEAPSPPGGQDAADPDDLSPEQQARREQKEQALRNRIDGRNN